MFKKLRLTGRTREKIAGYLFISPRVMYFSIFFVVAASLSLYFSFCKYDLFNPPEFVGIKGYVHILTKDPLIWQALKVTAIYSVMSVFLGLVVGFLLALLLNQKLKGIGMLRTAYYLPVVLPLVAVTILWKMIFTPQIGLLNIALGKIGITGPNWLMDPFWVLPAFVVMSLWGVGGSMLIYFAGLQGIPTQLYEAAEIDGANIWQKFWKVTLPMMTPVIFFNLIMGITGSFQVFTQGFIMTGGGPMNASLFYVLYLYLMAFQRLRMGLASVMAWILFIVVLGLNIIVIRSSSLWLYYEGELKGKK